MRNSIVSFLICIVIASCQQNQPITETPDMDAKIAQLEVSYANTSSPQVHKELLDLYALQRADTTLTDDLRMKRARYLAEADYSNLKHQEAFDELRAAIIEFPSAQGRAEAALLMAEIAIQRLNEPATANVIFAFIRDRYPTSAAAGMIPEAYEVRSIQSVIEELQREVFTSEGFNRSAAINYGKASWVYTAIETNENAIVKDHIASGRILEEASHYPMALKHYREVITRYPQNEKAGDAAFLEAFIILEQQNNKQKGISLMNAYLENYPNHKLNTDAKKLVEMAN